MTILINKNTTHQLVTDLLWTAFPRSKKVTVIDYGCGNGLLLSFLGANRVKKYDGYDINADSLKSAREKYSRNKKISFQLIKKGQIPILGKSNYADAVILVGVIQYMSDQEINDFLKKTFHVLKKNGLLIITCTTDHLIYRLINIYRLFIPNRFINRKKLVNKITKAGFQISFIKEKGLIIAPFFSNFIVFFFDALDKIFFRTKGILGPFGTNTRLLADNIVKLEYKLPVDWGYALILKAKKG